MIKVMIVDDHDLVRHGLKKLLADEENITVVGEAKSGEDAVQLARSLSPHVVLMDLNMPGIGGIEATKRLKRLDPSIKVLVVTACEEDPFPTILLKVGAMGFISKGANGEEMITAIISVNCGRVYISPEIAQKMAMKHVKDGDRPAFDKLSDRELQVLMMVASGQKAPEIADKLCLSSKTINSYRYRIFEKLGINSDVDLTRLALRYGLIEGSPLDMNTEEDS